MSVCLIRNSCFTNSIIFIHYVLKLIAIRTFLFLTGSDYFKTLWLVKMAVIALNTRFKVSETE